MGLSLSDYQGLVPQLLPKGRAWQGANLNALVQGFASEFERIDQQIQTLWTEALPSTTQNCIADWERITGLPSAAFPASSVLGQRQANVVAKLSAQGGQSKAYLISVMANLGYTATITDGYRPFEAGFGVAGQPIYSPAWAYTFTVNVTAIPSTEFLTWVPTNSELRQYTNTRLESAIAAIAPGHTVALYAYTGAPVFTTYDAMIEATTGIIHYWPCNETSGSLVDRVGSVNLSQIGSPIYNLPSLVADGESCIWFNPYGPTTHSYFRNSITDSSTNWSAEFWCKPTIISGSQVLLSWDTATPDIFINPSGVLSIYEAGNTFNSLATLAAGTVYHVVVTFNGSTATYYVNGVQMGTSTVSGIGLVPSLLYLGMDNGGTFYDGLMSKVAIYNTVLSQQVIQSHYALGV